MRTFKKIYCRTYQSIMRVACNLIKWPKPRIISGENALDNTIQDLKDNNLSMPLIIVPSFLMKGELIPSFIFKFKNHLEIRDLINPTIQAVEEMVSIYNHNDCDCVIAIGGGSIIDLGKATAARVSNPKQSIKKMKGVLKIKHKLIPLYVAPTTAGSGSEATVAAVITDGDTHEKFPINDPKLTPSVNILEPRLTCSLPKYITAITGMDALTHAIECYIGNSNTKQTRKDSIEATKLILDNLLDAYNDGNNIVARTNMQKGANLAGSAFTRGYVGYVHALAHQLGGLYNVQHGEANAILLPYVLKAYGKECSKRLHQLSIDIGKPDLDLISEIIKLNKELNIPTKVKELKEEDYITIVTRADKEGNPLYPVPRLMDKYELVNILKEVTLEKDE